MILIPKLPEDATPYQVLDFFREFKDACEVMAWSTGATQFSKIKSHLQGMHEETWNESLEAIGNGRSNGAFIEARTIFLWEILEEKGGCDTQIDYLRTIKEPCEMDVTNFLQNLPWR